MARKHSEERSSTTTTSIPTSTSPLEFLDCLKANHDVWRAERIHEHLNNPDFISWYHDVTGNAPNSETPDFVCDAPHTKDIDNAIEAYSLRNCFEECPVDLNYATWFRCRHDRKMWTYRDGEFRRVACPKVLEDDRRKERTRIQAILADLSIPKLYASTTFETFQPQNESQQLALRMAKEYAEGIKEIESHPTSLYLCGPVGTGKTHLAISILKTVCLRGIKGDYVRVIDVLNRLRPPLGDDTLREHLKIVDFLVLDDLGAQKNSLWTLEQIEGIIEERCAELRPMVITSNLPLELLGKGDIENERIVDRIKEMCAVVLIRGDSYREKIAKERRRG
jgi:DNA replication protein DnaC